MELDLCRLLITVIISIAVIAAAPVEINHQVMKRSVCKDFTCPPGYECCEDIDLCGGANCQPCIDGTFSSGREICQNCSNCLQGEKMIEVCTRTNDTICECPAGKYITSYRVCKPCSTCSEGEDCGECQLTITPTRSTSITAKTAVPASETSIAKHGSPCQCTCKQDISWYYLLLTAFFSPVIVLAILKWGKKIVCFWTRESKQYYADNCSCCPSWCCFRGGQKVNQPNSGPNGPNDPNGRNDSEANETTELDEMNERYERNEQNETIEPNERNEQNEIIEPSESGGGEEEDLLPSNLPNVNQSHSLSNVDLNMNGREQKRERSKTQTKLEEDELFEKTLAICKDELITSFTQAIKREIGLALNPDKSSACLQNWRELALLLGIEKQIMENLQNKMESVFDYLAATNPNATVTFFLCNLKKLKRPDVIKIMYNYLLDDGLQNC